MHRSGEHVNKLLPIVWVIIMTCRLLVPAQAESLKTEPLFREIIRPFQTFSPTIKRLVACPKGQRQEEVNHLLKQLAGQGPLVEPDPLDEQMVYVTFFIPYPQPQRTVQLEIFGTYDNPSLDDKKLEKLEHTDVWAQSYKFPLDICFSYRFHLTDGKGHEKSVIDALIIHRIPHGPEQEMSWSVLDLECPDERYNRLWPDIAHGQGNDVPFYSTHLKNERQITLYLPPGYDARRPQPGISARWLGAFTG